MIILLPPSSVWVSERLRKVALVSLWRSTHLRDESLKTQFGWGCGERFRFYKPPEIIKKENKGLVIASAWLSAETWRRRPVGGASLWFIYAESNNVKVGADCETTHRWSLQIIGSLAAMLSAARQGMLSFFFCLILSFFFFAPALGSGAFYSCNFFSLPPR